jgi:hypothetical protein
MLYETFGSLKNEISSFHHWIIAAKANMTDEFCSISQEELHKARCRLENKLENFDQDWAIFEKSYVQELMSIEADARMNVIEAISICK